MPSIDLPSGIDVFGPQRAKLLDLANASIQDQGIVGMAIKGSFALGIADEFSDLDLSFVTNDDQFDQVLARRPQLISAPSEPIALFTAEHVGLPDLLIVLYDDLVHADFRHVRLKDFPEPEEDLPCHIVWQRDEFLSGKVAGAQVPTSEVNVDWMEARMWTWVWYTQTKILRGELYEALDALQFIRSRVLFPLLAMTRRTRPGGSRRAEQLVGELKQDFAATSPSLDASAAMRSLQVSAALYMRLADPLLQSQGSDTAERARGPVLDALDAGLDWEPPGRAEEFAVEAGPPAPEYLNVSDIARALSMTRQSIAERLRRGSLPRPDGLIGARRTPIWRRSTLERDGLLGPTEETHRRPD